MSLDVTPARLSPATVFAAALTGATCLVHGMDAPASLLPVGDWLGIADRSDRAFLAGCTGPTLDVGCGPGRMSAHLAERGVAVLGIDVVAEAVASTRARGACALHRDVFEDLPGEGRWERVLLADGNIGIGGDPVRLLRRVESLLAPGGRAVVDLASPGVGAQTFRVVLECGGRHSHPFRWSVLGPDAVRMVAAEAGLYVERIHEHDGRWFAELEKEV